MPAKLVAVGDETLFDTNYQDRPFLLVDPGVSRAVIGRYIGGGVRYEYRQVLHLGVQATDFADLAAQWSALEGDAVGFLARAGTLGVASTNAHGTERIDPQGLRHAQTTPQPDDGNDVLRNWTRTGLILFTYRTIFLPAP